MSNSSELENTPSRIMAGSDSVEIRVKTPDDSREKKQVVHEGRNPEQAVRTGQTDLNQGDRSAGTERIVEPQQAVSQELLQVPYIASPRASKAKTPHQIAAKTESGATVHEEQEQQSAAKTDSAAKVQEQQTIADDGAKAQAKEADDANAQSDENKNECRFKADVKFDTAENAMVLVKEYMQYLESIEEFDSQEVLNILKSIHRMYSFFKKSKLKIGCYLAELGFPQLAKKMTIYFNRVGVFKNDNVWFPCYYLQNNIWNYTDSCVELAKDICSAGLIHYYALNMSHKPYLENRSSKNVSYVLKSSMSILQNLIRHSPESKPLFVDENLIEILHPFLDDADDFLKCVSIMILSSIISEDEIAKMEDTGYIAFMIKLTKTAMKSQKRRCRGFAVLELVQALARIAVSDHNKKKIVDEDALVALVELLKTGTDDEKQHAAKTIWTLCFDDYSKEKVKVEPGCMEALEALHESENAHVKKAANGALWKLKEEAAHRRERTTVQGPAADKHIFLSYNHAHSEMVHRVKDQLKADGYKVWIDSEQMGGSTLEAMAAAVENALVVLVCASEKYKLSPNCREEAEYTFQLKRPVVPLMMQRRYKADGWLGMLMGAKKYVNFDGKFEFSYAYEMLKREIQRYVRPEDSTDAGESQTPAAVVRADDAMLYAGAPASPPELATRCRSYKCSSWTSEEVQSWLNKSDFKIALNPALQALLRSMDGKRLVAFCHIQKKAPDFFYNKLSSSLGADMLELSYLTHALDELP